MLNVLMAAPTPSPAAVDVPSWADKLEAWSTLGGAVAALAAAVFTLWLLLHQIGEARHARQDATNERAEAAVDRELARKDRELAAAERRDAVKAQARTIVIGDVRVSTRQLDNGFAVQRLLVPVSNHSTGPVLDLRVVLDSETSDVPGLPILLEETGVLGPDETKKYDYVVRLDTPWGTTQEEAVKNVQISIAFTDTAGVQWTRRVTEQPEQVLDSNAATDSGG